MANYFEINDPRGYRVVCTENTWNDHILGFHPDMTGEEDRVKKAIQAPSLGIFQDADFPDRQIYYLRLGIPARYYVKVVVSFDKENQGTIITAFFADSPKAGEKLIWPT